MINWTRADFAPQIQINKYIKKENSEDFIRFYEPYPYPLRSCFTYRTEHFKAYDAHKVIVYRG